MNTNIKENIILYFKNNPHKIITKVKLGREIMIKDYEKRVFDESIKELLKENILIKTKKEKLVLNRNLDFVIGTIYTNSKGFGFVVSSDEKAKDLFIPTECIRNALHEDRVVARVLKKAEMNKRAEGEVISILSRKLETVIGTFMASEGFGFVIPDNQKIKKDIYIPLGSAKDAQSYDKVVCQITKYPERNRNPEGEVVEIIGVKWDKGVDVLSIVKEHNLSPEFPAKVLKAVEQLTDKIGEEERKKRADLRDINIFTIDGEDAKDLDDAISIELDENGNYKLGVHIADVSHYVKQGSKVDAEALNRGTSVYLIDTVIPMLPAKLSNNLCSLTPGTDKLTLSVFMTINKKGAVIDHIICESIIKTVARLNYTEVSDFLEKDDKVFANKYHFITKDLKLMEELYRILQKRRDDRGSIEFDFPEAKIILDENGKVKDVAKYDRRTANDLIEEFMLVCNETVAEDFYWKKIPFVYRVHENPREEKLREFSEFIKRYDHSIPENLEKIEPKMLQELLQKVKGTKEERAFNLILLRCMQQARYQPTCKGHFGLATHFYTHFTSPIRRYPDLQIHRIIKECIKGHMNTALMEHYEETVENCAKLSSKRERVAEQAEKELYEIRKLEFMEDKIGQAYEGMVTGFNNNVVFITLDNTVEGVLRIDRIKDDIYELDKEAFAIVGKNPENKIMMGDKILVSVERVELDTKELFFDFISK